MVNFESIHVVLSETQGSGEAVGRSKEGSGKLTERCIKKSIHLPPEQTVLRKVPLAVKNRLVAELNQLETLGVLKKVLELTHWVSSLVIVEKKDSQKL